MALIVVSVRDGSADRTQPAVPSPRTVGTQTTPPPAGPSLGEPAVTAQTPERKVVERPIVPHFDRQYPTGAVASEPASVAAQPSDRSEAMATGLDEAETALAARHYARAHELAMNLAPAKGNPRVLRVAVTAACALGDRAAATSYLEAAPRELQQDLRFRCGSVGMKLDRTPPAPPQRAKP